jgi:hypothetical protein
LKGVDRVKAGVLLEAGQQAGCQARLALLTFHESGSAEGDYGYYGGYSRWYDDEDEYDDEEESGDYEMGEVFETSLTADHWSDSQGNRLDIGSIDVKEDELLDPETVKDVEPEEEFEGYTGNAGMTLDRWYRHGAIVLWPNQRHYDILCDAGTHHAVQVLKLMVNEWQRAGRKKATAIQAECIEFAAKIIARWQENPYGRGFGEAAERSSLLHSLAVLDEPGLIQRYFAEVIIKDAAEDPGKSLVQVCQKHGWGVFRRELEAVFHATTAETLERNVRLLEHICLAKPRNKEGWTELCQALAPAVVQALETVDQEKKPHDFRASHVDRTKVLTVLARALLASEQPALLSRLVAHTLARPEKYPLTVAQVPALTALQPWLKSHVKKRCPPLSHWIASCCAQLESLTAQAPQPPADYRRAADVACKCADCRELKKFLGDAHEQVHRFRAVENRRRHLEDSIRQYHCDVNCKTERHGSPYTLVCTKNTASYQAALKTYHQNQERLATLRAIQASLPK